MTFEIGSLRHAVRSSSSTGQGRGDLLAFVLSSPETARDVFFDIPARRPSRKAGLPINKGLPHHRSAKRDPLVPPFIAASFVYKHAVHRSARHPA
jgi:hypothetical protein